MNWIFLFVVVVVCVFLCVIIVGNWLVWRGVEGIGVSKECYLLICFSVMENVVWKILLLVFGNSMFIVWN